MATKKDYIDFLLPIYNDVFPREKEKQRRFLESDALNHMGFDMGFSCVDMALLFYEYFNDDKYLKDAKDYFVNFINVFNKYKKNNAIPDKPIVNRMFGVAPLCEEYMRIKALSPFTKKEENDFYAYLVNLTNWMVQYPEWGTHNRASIRGLGLYNSYRAFPDRPMSRRWEMAGLGLIGDALGKWAQEDASTYHPIWVEDIYDMYDMGLAKAYPQQNTLIRFYLDYVAYTQTHQFIPLEFGDGRMGTQWGHYVHILERGAKDFGNKEYKYVADRIFNKMKTYTKFNCDRHPYDISQARALVRAAHYCDDDVEMKEIYPYSMETIDDVITKKIIFKSGLDETKDTSLFLNYKDEIENSYLGRKNLDWTICAPAEKNHHGHTDENSIDVLQYKDAILLHDGGYREKIDLKGAWRADFYHNKLIFRNETKDTLQDTLHLEEYYNKVKSHKVYFRTTKCADFSRTCVDDFKHNVEYDRCITYIKDLNIFVVNDIVKSKTKQSKFISNQYFSKIIEEIKPDVYQTRFDKIVSDELRDQKEPDDKSLTIYFAQKMEGSKYAIEEMRRSYTEENILTSYGVKEFKKGETLSLVTILIPNDNEYKKELIDSIKIENVANGTLVSILDKYFIAHRLDITKNFVPERRPCYEFKRVHNKYSIMDTDALLSFVHDDNGEIDYAFIFGSKLIYKGKTLFALKEHNHEFYQADISMVRNIGSYTYYEDTIKK